MKDMVIAEPTRETWRLFCDEPELTPEELALWTEIKRAARDNTALKKFFLSNLQEPGKVERTVDWSDMVQSTDAHRRYVREHFALYEQWKGR